MWYALGYFAFCLVCALGLGRFIKAGSGEPATLCTGNCNQGRACDCCDNLVPATGLVHYAGHDEAWLDDAYDQFTDANAEIFDERDVFKLLMRDYATKCVREALSQVRECV